MSILWGYAIQKAAQTLLVDPQVGFENSEVWTEYTPIPRRGEKKGLTRIPRRILLGGMIRADFLDEETREELTAVVRDGKAETRVTRRASALLLLDKGWSCERVAEALFMDDDIAQLIKNEHEKQGCTIEGCDRNPAA